MLMMDGTKNFTTARRLERAGETPLPRQTTHPTPTNQQTSPPPPQQQQTNKQKVVWGVINWQRRFEAYAAAQRARRWDQGIEARANLDSCDVRVGVMGFGARRVVYVFLSARVRLLPFVWGLLRRRRRRRESTPGPGLPNAQHPHSHHTNKIDDTHK
jgi:hypothetical protein